MSVENDITSYGDGACDKDSLSFNNYCRIEEDKNGVDRRILIVIETDMGYMSR